MKSLTATRSAPEHTDTTTARASLRAICGFLGVLFAAYFCADAALFRTGLYGRFLDPDKSATGYIERGFDMEVRRPPSRRKDVLVVGSSRVAEGFSAKLANERAGKPDYFYVNYGFSGTGARVWYYLVRDIDPHRDRYSAIVLPVDDYDDNDDYEDVADRAGEMPLVLNRLKLTDIIPYTLSYTSWKSRREVLRGLLIPSIVYQRDLQDFFEHPKERLHRIEEYRAKGAQESYEYGGMEGSMAGLEVDHERKTVTCPKGMSEKKCQDLHAIFLSRPPQHGRYREYEMRWLGALVDLYRGSKTRIIVVQVPRSPAPRPKMANLPWTIIDDLKKRDWVRVVDRHLFEDLEKPEFFGDYVHLNSTGRKIFSPRLADEVERMMGDAAAQRGQAVR